MKDQTEVCPLSRGVMFLDEGNPYPVDYRSAFAFSVLPYPPHCRRALRHAFPGGSTTGLPSSKLRVRSQRAINRSLPSCLTS